MIIGIVGLFVGAEIITAGQATWLLVGLAGAGGVSAFLSRREEIEATGYTVPVPETIVHSAGDIVGVSQIVEGIDGRRLGTYRPLSSVERSDSLGTGSGAAALLITGSRAYRGGQRVGQGWVLRQRGATPRGPEGGVREPLPDARVPPAPRPHPTAGPVERAARARLPEEIRVGFDRWMEQVREGGADPELMLGRLDAIRIERVSRANAAAYQAAVEAGTRAESIRSRAGSDPLDPDLAHTERRGNITIRSEARPPPPTDAEVGQAQRLQAATGEPVTLFGRTPAGRDYPGIDGTIGSPPRALSLKRSDGAANAGYVRVHAADAYSAAVEHGYTHVEVHIEMSGSTLAQVRAGWLAPRAVRGEGPVVDSAGTIARIVIRALDGEWIITPPLTGPALSGVLPPDRAAPSRDDRDSP